MIPLRDDIPARSRPWVNAALIAACVLVFLQQRIVLGEAGRDLLAERYGLVAARILQPGRPVITYDQVVRRGWFGPVIALRPRLLDAPRVSPLVTFLTHLFLHGGWLHL